MNHLSMKNPSFSTILTTHLPVQSLDREPRYVQVSIVSPHMYVQCAITRLVPPSFKKNPDGTLVWKIIILKV